LCTEIVGEKKNTQKIITTSFAKS